MPSSVGDILVQLDGYQNVTQCACLRIRTLSVAFQKVSAFFFLGLWLSRLFDLGTASLGVVLWLYQVVLFLFLFLLLLVSRVSIHAGADAIHGVGAGTFRLSGLRDCGPCSRWRAGCVIRLALRPSSAIGRHRCRAVGTCLRFLTFREFLVSLGKQVQAICGSACCIVGADVSSIIVLIRCD